MSCRPDFRRYTLQEVFEEVLNDHDNNDKCMLGGDDSDSDEEETEFNQHHPLLSELLHDDGDRDFKPHTGSSSNPDKAVAEIAASAAVPSTGILSPPVIRGRVQVKVARSQGEAPVQGASGE